MISNSVSVRAFLDAPVLMPTLKPPPRRGISGRLSTCFGVSLVPASDRFQTTTVEEPPASVARMTRQLFIEPKPEAALKKPHLVVAGISDVHLMVIPDYDGKRGRSGQKTLINNIKTVEQYAQDSKNDVLFIINGDLFDITRSWHKVTQVNPFKADYKERQTAVKEILNKIVDNNRPAITALKDLLRHENVKARIPWGNHDGWLKDPEIQAHVRKLLGLKYADNQLVFTRRYFEPETGLLVVHGDEFDPSCCADAPDNALSFSERFDLVIAEEAKKRFKQKLVKNGYNDDLLSRVDQLFDGLGDMTRDNSIMKYLHDEIMIPGEIKRFGRALGVGERLWVKITNGFRSKHPKPVHILFVESWQEALDGNIDDHKQRRWLLRISNLLSGMIQFSLGRRLGDWGFKKTVLNVREPHAQRKEFQRLITELEHHPDIQAAVNAVRPDDNKPAIRYGYLGHVHEIQEDCLEHPHYPKQCFKLYNAGSYIKTVCPKSGDETFKNGILLMNLDRTVVPPDLSTEFRKVSTQIRHHEPKPSA